MQAQKQFRFNDNVRPIVENLAKMLMWANNQDHDDTVGGRPVYASQRNLYGHISNAIKAIVVAECGESIYNQIENSRYGFNFGGNHSWLEDIEVAIDQAHEEIGG